MMKMVHPGYKNADFKEGAKLLEMETSSESDHEHFVLRPSKGSRKRRSGKSSGCQFCSSGPAVVAVVCTVAILLCVLVLAPFVYELKQDVDKLKNIALAGQSKNNPEEFRKIHKQQRELEKAITDMRTGNGGILHNRMNITLILKQLKTLNVTTHMLSESLAAAPQLKALPNTVNDLKQEIADVGSKLRSLQDSIEELQNNKKVLTDKVDSMKKKLNGMVRVVSGATEKPGTVKPAETGSPEMMQEISGLSAALRKMNTSTWQQFGVVMARGQQHEVQIAGLRNVTHDFESRLRLVELAGSTRPEYNLSSVMQQAVNSVKEELLNLSESAGESAVSALRADITALNTSLHNINTAQKSNVSVGSAQGTPAGVTSLSSYMSSTDDKLQQLQTSLASVVYNITAMDTRIKSHEGRLSVVETSIKSTHDIPTDDTRTTDSSTHMSQSEQTNDQSDQHTGQTSNADQIDKKSSLKLDTNKDALVGTDQTGSTNTQDILIHEGLPRGRTGSGIENVNPVETKTTPQTTHLKSAEDLAEQFKMWDRDINGHVSYSDIVFYLGAFVPTEQSFKKYDTNGDGEYSLSELNIAFGFDSDSSEAVTQANSATTTMSERGKP